MSLKIGMEKALNYLISQMVNILTCGRFKAVSQVAAISAGNDKMDK